MTDTTGAVGGFGVLEGFAMGRLTQPKQYEWKPKEDITTYELALCVPIIVYGGYNHGVEYLIIALPENAQRHFQEIEQQQGNMVENRTGMGTVQDLAREILKAGASGHYWMELWMDIDGKRVNLEAVVTMVDEEPKGKQLNFYKETIRQI